MYGAEVIDSDLNSETYTGLTSNTFKKRFYKHRSSFQHEDQGHEYTLTAQIWDLKRRNKHFDIEWGVKDKPPPPFDPISKKCRLCLREKFHIIFQSEGAN